MNVFGYSFFSEWKISCKFSKKGWEHWYNQSSIIAISVVMSFKLCKLIFMLRMNIHGANEYSCCKWIFMLQTYIHCKWIYAANEYSAAWLMELIVSVVWGDKSPLSEEDQTSQRTSFALSWVWCLKTFVSQTVPLFIDLDGRPNLSFG